MSFEFKLPKTMPSWLEDVHTHGEVIHIHFADAYDDGVSDNTFAVASSKKELKQLKKSDADIVYYERKGKLYLNGNGHEKGWGEKDIGGLIVKVKGKPEIAADDISGFQQYSDQDGHGQIDDVDDTTPMQTMFSSKSEAKKAAKNFGCKGAHKMGDQWMVCKHMDDLVMPDGSSTEHDHSGNDHSGHDHSGHDHSGHDHASHRIV